MEITVIYIPSLERYVGIVPILRASSEPLPRKWKFEFFKDEPCPEDIIRLLVTKEDFESYIFCP